VHRANRMTVAQQISANNITPGAQLFGEVSAAISQDGSADGEVFAWIRVHTLRVCVLRVKFWNAANL